MMLVTSAAPFFFFDLIETAYMVYTMGLPMYSAFMQLDPFIVVAVVAVNYMNFLLLALATK